MNAIPTSPVCFKALVVYFTLGQNNFRFQGDLSKKLPETLDVLRILSSLTVCSNKFFVQTMNSSEIILSTPLLPDTAVQDGLVTRVESLVMAAVGEGAVEVLVVAPVDSDRGEEAGENNNEKTNDCVLHVSWTRSF